MVIVFVTIGILVLISIAVAAWHQHHPDPEDMLAQATADIRWADVELRQQTNSVRWNIRSDMSTLKDAAYREMDASERR